ncbi:MAG TPA: hypothetical protein VGD04_06570 [Methylophilus sp.]
MIDKVIFVPRANIEAIEGWKHWAVISIIEPGHKQVKLGKGWSHTLHMVFHDLDPERYADLTDSEESQNFMTIEQATMIVKFVRGLPDDTEGIVVQCLAGVSRSAAIAKWIAGQYRIPFSKHYDKYNKHVYKLMIEASKEAKV